MILDLWGISFHAVVLFGLGKNLLFKSILGRCVRLPTSALRLKILAAAVENKCKSCKQVVSKHVTKKY